MCIETIKAWQLAGIIITIIKIVVPIILIITSIINTSKLVISSKPDDIKPAVILFIKKFIAAIIIFIVPSLIDSLIGMLVDYNTNNYKECRACLFNPTNDECYSYVKQYEDSRKYDNGEDIDVEGDNLDTDSIDDIDNNSSSNTSTNTNLNNIKGAKSSLEDKSTYYNKRVEIGKILVGDNTRIIKVLGDGGKHRYPNSCTVVNGNIVTTLGGGSFSAKTDTSTRVDTYNIQGELLKSSTGRLGHANGMDYISKTNELVVSGINNNSFSHQVYFINYDDYYNNGNIKINSKTLPTMASEIAYDPSSNKLYVRHKPTISIYDASTLKEEGSIKEVPPYHRDQDMTVYKGLLLVGVNETRLSNWIDIYRLKDNKYLGSYHILSDDGKYTIEFESLSVYGDKQLILYFNRSVKFPGEVHLVNIDI